MKNIKAIVSCMIILVVVMVAACHKEAGMQNNWLQSQNDISQMLALSPCDQFAYADSIFFQSPVKSNYIVKPLKLLTGKYGAFPTGLKINPVNGNINVSTSETGLQYLIWFIPQGSADTCFKYITLSGIDYDDSIYVLSAHPKSLGKPIYNANTSLAVDCSGGCEFDDGPDDDNGNGIADEPQAGQEVIPQGIVINKKTGVIDFKKSIENGALGKNPISGANKEFVLNYRIGDKSSKALNRVRFHLFYYKTQAEIPEKLLDDVLAKKGQVILEDEDKDDDDEDDDNDGGHHGHGGHKGPSLSFAVSQSLAQTQKKGKDGNKEVKCRPPYIIITQQ